MDKRPDALFVAGDPLFTNRRVQLATLAARYGVTLTTFPTREYAEAGGLMSYGSNLRIRFVSYVFTLAASLGCQAGGFAGDAGYQVRTCH